MFQDVDKSKFGHRQCPQNAWCMEVVPRAVLVDVRTFHSALEPSNRSSIAGQLNDPKVASAHHNV